MRDCDEKVLRFDNLTINFNRRCIYVGGNGIELTAMEFEILSLFAKNVSMVLTRDQILEHLKGMDWEPFNRSIDVLISRLRNK